jgi:hypothetical protein
MVEKYQAATRSTANGTTSNSTRPASQQRDRIVTPP